MLPALRPSMRLVEWKWPVAIVECDYSSHGELLSASELHF